MPPPTARSSAPKLLLDLQDAAPLVGFAHESLRKMMFNPPHWLDGDLPPLIKQRGRWKANPTELRAWAKRHADYLGDGVAS